MAAVIVAVTVGLVLGSREKDQVIYMPRATRAPIIFPIAPSAAPTMAPTLSAAHSGAPSYRPSNAPTISLTPSMAPTVAPTVGPTISSAPTGAPNAGPTETPTISVALSIDNFSYMDFLPYWTQVDIDIDGDGGYDSPQRKTLDWIQTLPKSKLKAMSKWRQLH